MREIQRLGTPVQALINKPEIPFHLQDYYIAFLELNRRRQYSMAELPLLMTEIESYCRVFDFEEDKEFFFRLIFMLDSEYMKMIAEKRNREKPEEPAKKPGLIGRMFGK